MTKIAYAALFVALTASTAGFAQTTISCSSGDPFCTDTNNMLQSIDNTVTQLGNMNTSSASLGTDISTATTLNGNLQTIMSLPENNCPSSCTPTTCDAFCTLMVGYSTTLNGDIGALTNDQATVIAEIDPTNGSAVTATKTLQSKLQSDFQTVLTDMQTAESDLGAVCLAYSAKYGVLGDVCNTPSGQAAMATFNKHATPKQKATLAAAKASLQAKQGQAKGVAPKAR